MMSTDYEPNPFAIFTIALMLCSFGFAVLIMLFVQGIPDPQEYGNALVLEWFIAYLSQLLVLTFAITATAFFFLMLIAGAAATINEAASTDKAKHGPTNGSTDQPAAHNKDSDRNTQSVYQQNPGTNRQRASQSGNDPHRTRTWFEL